MSLTSLRRRVARALPGLHILLFVLGVALAVVAGAPAAGAQVFYGSIVGHVQDSTGAALPGATVLIRHEETKLTREAVSRRHGRLHVHGGPEGPESRTGHERHRPGRFALCHA